jgi:hypothetical protein
MTILDALKYAPRNKLQCLILPPEVTINMDIMLLLRDRQRNLQHISIMGHLKSGDIDYMRFPPDAWLGSLKSIVLHAPNPDDACLYYWGSVVRRKGALSTLNIGCRASYSHEEYWQHNDLRREQIMHKIFPPLDSPRPVKIQHLYLRVIALPRGLGEIFDFDALQFLSLRNLDDYAFSIFEELLGHYQRESFRKSGNKGLRGLRWWALNTTNTGEVAYFLRHFSGLELLLVDDKRADEFDLSCLRTHAHSLQHLHLVINIDGEEATVRYIRHSAEDLDELFNTLPKLRQLAIPLAPVSTDISNIGESNRDAFLRYVVGHLCILASALR